MLSVVAHRNGGRPQVVAVRKDRLLWGTKSWRRWERKPKASTGGVIYGNHKFRLFKSLPGFVEKSLIVEANRGPLIVAHECPTISDGRNQMNIPAKQHAKMNERDYFWPLVIEAQVTGCLVEQANLAV